MADVQARKFDDRPSELGGTGPETVAGALGVSSDPGGAKAGDIAPDAPVEMDYAEHHRTYQGFVVGLKWATIAVVTILVLMAFFLVRGH